MDHKHANGPDGPNEWIRPKRKRTWAEDLEASWAADQAEVESRPSYKAAAAARRKPKPWDVGTRGEGWDESLVDEVDRALAHRAKHTAPGRSSPLFGRGRHVLPADPNRPTGAPVLASEQAIYDRHVRSNAGVSKGKKVYLPGRGKGAKTVVVRSDRKLSKKTLGSILRRAPLGGTLYTGSRTV